MAPRTRALKTHGAGVICLFIGENATKRKKTAGGQECFVTVILLVKAVRARGLSTHDNRGICILALPNRSCIKTCSVVISGHPMGLKLDQGFQEHRSQCSCQQWDWFIFCYKQIFSKTWHDKNITKQIAKTPKSLWTRFSSYSEGFVTLLWAVMDPRTRALKTHGAGGICWSVTNKLKRAKAHTAR